ncbi:MAG: hypothetical protein V4585_05940 [Bacteroidota bacterium]
MPIYNIPKLERIIKNYQSNGRKQVDNHVSYCVGQTNLKNAIEVAAKAVDENNKTHFHQRRVGRTELNIFAEKLVLFEEEVNAVTTFDEIFDIVKKAHTEGVNELAFFDTAFRIGSFLKIFPDKIYLTSGTRIGAEHLLGSLSGKTFLLPEELPIPFQLLNLTVADIEDILYTYRDELEYCVK